MQNIAIKGFFRFEIEYHPKPFIVKTSNIWHLFV
jgi:hypothetical protein